LSVGKNYTNAGDSEQNSKIRLTENAGHWALIQNI